jgi:hypothetical protein
LPNLPRHSLENSIDQMELLGFTIDNPFILVDECVDNFIPAKDFVKYLGKTISALGYLVTTKPVYTIKKEYMCFGTFIDAAGDWIDTVHFPDSHQRHPIMGKGFYHLKGKVIEEFGVLGMEVHWMEMVPVHSKKSVSDELLEKAINAIPNYEKKNYNSRDAV